jgi:hypothetical protein
MIVNLNIDTTSPLTDRDRAVLLALADVPDAKVEPREAGTTSPTAKKTGAAKKAAAAKADVKAAEDFPTASERLPADETDEDLRAVALGIAGALLGADKENGTTSGREKVLAAVAEVGVERVSEAAEDDLPRLIELLSAEQ